METNKRAHPSDFGIPEEHWQAAADYAGMVIFQGESAGAKREAVLAAADNATLAEILAAEEASVERLARFLAEEACAGSCMEVPPDRWRGHVGDARDMLRAAAGLDKARTGEASPVRVLAAPVTCNVGDER